METPRIDHLSLRDYEVVYEPAEDSFLLLDALESDLEYLDQKQPSVCVEIGSGSGVIITALAKRFPQSMCMATDINPHACRITKKTAACNQTSLDSIHCNLLDGLRPNSIDLLVFNPPYVVTSDEELQEQKFPDEHSATRSNLVYSWAGGAFGRRIVDKLLPQLAEKLSAQGVFYLLLLRENKPDEVMQQLDRLNFMGEKFMERHIPGEFLYIYKITRKS